MAQEQSFADLQAIALSKSEDAVLLLHHGRFSNAYYLAGYAVEIGLKASIALRFRAEHLPDRRLVNAIHTHNVNELLFHSGLKDLLDQKFREDPRFEDSWTQVNGWSPDSRYSNVGRLAAQDMVHAVSDPQMGILEWIRGYW